MVNKLGRRIIVRRRGKATQVFRSIKHRKIGPVHYYPLIDFGEKGHITAKILDFVHEKTRNVPIGIIEYENGDRGLWLPPEGIFTGDTIQIGTRTEIAIGNTMQLQNIPEGTYIYNIEIRPGDGGKMVRASGSAAIIMTKVADGVVIQMPSGKRITVNPLCRATIGCVAAGGKTTRPFVKAGNKVHWAQGRTVLWPRPKGMKMNANSHPFGGGKKGHARPTTTARNTPPGRKVGKIAARRTGLSKK